MIESFKTGRSQDLAKNNQENILPNVLIEQHLSPLQKIAKGTRTSEVFLIKDENENVVGSFTLSISRPRDKAAVAYLNTINVNSARGKGYGRAAYLKIVNYLKQQNIQFISSEYQLSRDAKKVWDWLVQEGKARLIDEGKTSDSSLNEGYSTARYEAL